MLIHTVAIEMLFVHDELQYRTLTESEILKPSSLGWSLTSYLHPWEDIVNLCEAIVRCEMPSNTEGRGVTTIKIVQNIPGIKVQDIVHDYFRIAKLILSKAIEFGGAYPLSEMGVHKITTDVRELLGAMDSNDFAA